MYDQWERYRTSSAIQDELGGNCGQLNCQPEYTWDSSKRTYFDGDVRLEKITEDDEIREYCFSYATEDIKMCFVRNGNCHAEMFWHECKKIYLWQMPYHGSPLDPNSPEYDAPSLWVPEVSHKYRVRTYKDPGYHVRTYSWEMGEICRTSDSAKLDGVTADKASACHQIWNATTPSYQPHYVWDHAFETYAEWRDDELPYLTGKRLIKLDNINDIQSYCFSYSAADPRMCYVDEADRMNYVYQMPFAGSPADPDSAYYKDLPDLVWRTKYVLEERNSNYTGEQPRKYTWQMGSRYYVWDRRYDTYAEWKESQGWTGKRLKKLKNINDIISTCFWHAANPADVRMCFVDKDEPQNHAYQMPYKGSPADPESPYYNDLPYLTETLDEYWPDSLAPKTCSEPGKCSSFPAWGITFYSDSECQKPVDLVLGRHYDVKASAFSKNQALEDVVTDNPYLDWKLSTMLEVNLKSYSLAILNLKLHRKLC